MNQEMVDLKNITVKLANPICIKFLSLQSSTIAESGV